MLKLLVVLVCAWVPTQYLIKEYKIRPDLTQILFFGKFFQPRELKAIKELAPSVDWATGYDGQFYAQLSIDPLLTRPETANAMDDPAIRAPRILLPILAHILGDGNTLFTIRAYVLLNIFFWYLLLGILLYSFPTGTVRGALVACAILLSTGTLVSIQRSLTDLPAATLGLIGLVSAEGPSCIWLGLACLARPTSLLYLVRYACRNGSVRRDWAQAAKYALTAAMFPFVWQIYLSYKLHAGPNSGNNFGFPFVGWWGHLVSSWQNLRTIPPEVQLRLVTPWEFDLFEFLATASLTLQAIFIFRRFRWDKPLSLAGAAFAVLYFCVNHNVFVEQIAYARVVLPLTISFNLLLLEVRSVPLFSLYFIFGNIGLLFGLHSMVGSFRFA